MGLEEIAIIGGDERYYHCAEALSKKDYNVSLYGFEKYSALKKQTKINFKDLSTLIKAEIVILPLAPIKNDGTINAPFSKSPVYADGELKKTLSDKYLFCGMCEKLKAQNIINENTRFIDYGKIEDFVLKNAVLTAKAAVILCSEVTSLDLKNLETLILGWGRVGKACSKEFERNGSIVTVSARKQKDFDEIKKCNFGCIDTNKLNNLQDYKLIINTVPSIILDSMVLENMSRDSIIIDLASSPGGVDFNKAEKLNIKTIHALSLPGKYFPKEAGKIIAETISERLKSL